MTGDEFRQWREARLLTTAEVGALLGYGIRQVQRIESRGAKPIRRCIALALTAINRNLPPCGSEATEAHYGQTSQRLPRRSAKRRPRTR